MDLIREHRQGSPRAATSKTCSKYGIQQAGAPANASMPSCGSARTHSYSALVGSLMYLSICTRPDICRGSPGTDGQPHHRPAGPPPRALPRHRHHLRRRIPRPQALQQTTLATSTPGSTTGYAFIFNGGAISWAEPVASTTEAEYICRATTIKEGVAAQTFPRPERPAHRRHLRRQPDRPQAAKHRLQPFRTSLHHFARERVARQVTFECSESLADALTKPSPSSTFAVLMGLDIRQRLCSLREC